jgi:hypothetical protein blinB_18313
MAAIMLTLLRAYTVLRSDGELSTDEKENVEMMTHSRDANALEVATRYHTAWTCRNVEAAMELVADDVVCHAPDGLIEGKDAYQAYIQDFSQICTGVTNLASFGNEHQAVLMYCPHTVVTSIAPAVELFTVREGKIVESQLVFDRMSFAPGQD